MKRSNIFCFWKHLIDQNKLQNYTSIRALLCCISKFGPESCIFCVTSISIFSSKASSLRSINVWGFTANKDETSISVSKLCIYLQSFCESKARDFYQHIWSHPKTSFEDVPTLRRFPGLSLPICFGKHKSTNPYPTELFNSFVTMTTHWTPDLPDIKGFSCHLWRPILIFANGASYMYAWSSNQINIEFVALFDVFRSENH